MRDWIESDDLRERLLLFVMFGAVLLMFRPAVDVLAVLLPGGEELSYSYGVQVSSCGIEGAPCLTFVGLEVGNTGSEPQDLVELDFEGFPRWAASNYGVIKISASNEVLAPPAVWMDAESRKIRIEHLAANQMVQIAMTFAGYDAEADLKDARPVVSARGRVIESSPKATVLARAFRMAFAFLI